MESNKKYLSAIHHLNQSQSMTPILEFHPRAFEFLSSDVDHLLTILDEGSRPLKHYKIGSERYR